MEKATNEQTRELLHRMYSNGNKKVLTKKQINQIFAYHKESYMWLSSHEYWRYMPSDVRESVESVPSIKCMIDDYLLESSAIQSGALNECVISKAVADMLGATELRDLRSSSFYFTSLPEISYEIVSAVEGKTVRFAYVDPTRPDLLVAQCGGCDDGDLYVYEGDIEHKFEIKEVGAKAGEYDCVYDDKGCFSGIGKFPEHARPLLDELSSVDIWDYVGRNYKFKVETAEKVFEGYLARNGISVYATVDGGDPVFMSAGDLGHLGAISYKGSEMRMGGRNKAKVFAKGYLDKVLKNIGATVSSDGKRISVSVDSLVPAKGRGKDFITRWKLNPVFFVTYESCIIENDTAIFDIDDIFQLRPTVSVHVTFMGSPTDIESFYRDREYEC